MSDVDEITTLKAAAYDVVRELHALDAARSDLLRRLQEIEQRIAAGIAPQTDEG